MTQQLWTDLDRYLAEFYAPTDPVLEEVLEASKVAGLPGIQVSRMQGRFLKFVATLLGARRILEIGTLAGYSTIWMGRALPGDGKLVTLEAEPRHAELARKHIERAGLSEKVELRLGKAAETLAAMVRAGELAFDLIFVDADKPSIPEYYEWSLKLAHPGTLIIVDNVIRKGAIIDAKSEAPDVRALRHFNEVVAKDKRVTATTLQTVGQKGHDGMTFLLVKG